MLKAERLGELDGDAVWDESLLSGVAMEFFERVLRYLMGGGVDKTGFERRVKKIVEPRIRTAAMTLAEQFIQEGLEKGLEKGRRADILDALEIRFGTVPEGLREAVGQASGEERLKALHRAAITAATLEEFAGNL